MNNCPSESIRMGAVQTPVIPLVAQLIAEHPDTISLGQGVVYYPPPPEALMAARRFGEDLSEHKYGPVAGNKDLLVCIEQKLKTENALDLSNYRLLVTAGANMAFLNTLFAITDPGDEIILPVPYYFNQEMAIRMVNAVPVTVPCDTTFQPDLNQLESAITKRTRAIVTISPNNPSGAVYSKATLRAVNQLCSKYRIYHISDEAYEYFCFGNARHYSPASDPDAYPHTISLYSMSKAYGFASWRIGYMVFPADLLPALMKVQDTNLICATGIAQQAAKTAMTVGPSYWRPKIETIGSMREQCLNMLGTLGDRVAIAPSEGALYVLIKLETSLPALTVVHELVRNYGVAVIPGDTFGLTAGCNLRISFGALDMATVQSGLDRLANGLRALT